MLLPHLLVKSFEFFKEWSASDLCGIIVARGVGRAFCAGGDVASELSFKLGIEELHSNPIIDVIKDAENLTTRPQAINFFKRE
jgi:3-hydroxyisobutyryl-CoA hydrolase